MGRRQLVSVFTDAGYCPKTEAASWGFWYKGDDESSQGGGVLKLKGIKNSNCAEMCAVGNALHYLIRIRGYNNVHFHVQLDNDHVVRALIPGKNPRRTKVQIAVQEHIYNLLTEAKCSATFKHIHGHVDPEKGARYYVNNIADQMATKYLQEARKRKA